MYRMCIIVYWRAGEVVGVINFDMYEVHLSMYQSRVTGVDRRDNATFGIALTMDPRHSRENHLQSDTTKISRSLQKYTGL
jgi:hypothetical protein